jgi:beta-galactosidase/beta-glucuronidase
MPVDRETTPVVECSTDDPLYPRPLCRRPTWIPLDGLWDFSLDAPPSAACPSELPDWSMQIRVPFAPETEASGIGDTGFHPDVWYRRRLRIAVPEHSRRLLLHFGAVDYAARVWVNDHFVGLHEGGHTPFSFDITDVLRPDGEQEIVVWAHDDPHDLNQPRGKQDWHLEPHSIWYPRTTGIWQSVWLEEVASMRIERLVWTPNLERWEIGVAAYVEGRDGIPLEMRVVLRVDGRVLADDRYAVVENEVHRRISLSDPGIDDYRNELLWSPESPTLIEATISLVAEGAVLDEVQSYTAIRGISSQRGRFLLNNRPYYLRLVLDQGYWPESLMTPPSTDAIIRDIQLTKAAGFNGVRKHQKIEDPRYLYWADKLGLLVWEEMPSAYRFTRISVERIIREWIEVINRDISHPCIIVWVPYNESWGVPNLLSTESHRTAVQTLYSLTLTLDPSRPVIGNDGWENSSTDIIGIHDYDADPKRLARRYQSDARGVLPDLLLNGFPGGRVLTLEGHPHDGQPIMLTEFGGIALRTRGDTTDAAAWGYSVEDSAEELATKYTKLLEAVNGIAAFSGFCYTQLTDTFQEVNGLFTEDREPKIPLETIRTATNSLVHVLPQNVDAPRSGTEGRIAAAPGASNPLCWE